MSKFEQLINTHKGMIESDFDNVCEYLQTKAKAHDNDKIEPGMVNDIYEQHFPSLKQIEFGTDEYYAYEREHFLPAHKAHAQNRHHYYSHHNQTNFDIDLFDLLEAIIDIKQSQKQYSEFNVETIISTMRSKGALDLSLEELVTNTIIKIEQLDEE